MINLKSAIWYAENKNFSVIPVNKDKKPLIKWTEYQKKRADVAQIKLWWNKWPEAMVGIVTGKISGISVIDVDTEQGFKEINKLIPDSMIMPTVKTPKGGQHMYFKDCGLPNNARVIEGCDFRGEGGYIIAPPSKNGNGKCYEWLKDLKISEVDCLPVPSAYLSALADNSINYYNIDNNNNNSKECLQAVDSAFKEGRRDNDIFHTANCLVKGGMDKAIITQVIEMIIVSCYGKPDKETAKIKVESALKRKQNREESLSDEVENFVLSTNGNFLSTEVVNCLHLSTRKEKKNLSIILKRLCEKGIIEKYGNKNGSWRLIDNVCDDIDFMSAPEQSVDIKWPFSIEDQVKTMPKNIIIIAGEPNAGKTAFLLNVVEMNMYKHDIHYFSSEMGAIEMRERLKKFDTPLDRWKFTPKERVSNFGDVIKPNAVNIIDFLEVYDDFYRIGGMIKEIFDNLDKGIAIIAIQKNKGNEYGLGGMRGLEKARLYLTMEPGKLKIAKAKNWATFENPNNLEKEFKLIQGCKFIDDPYWKQTIQGE